jgi:hypothetical protein
MTKLLEEAIARIRQLPEDEQDRAAETLLALVGLAPDGQYKLSGDERAAVRRGLQELRDGKLASPEQVSDVFNRYR